MLPRLFAGLIVAFWLVMTSLLIRLEIAPEDSTVLDLPVSHVLKVMFTHRQQSVLNITENERPAGTVAIQPSVPSSDRRLLECAGTMTVRLPLLAPLRFAWNGAFMFDPQFRATHFTLELNTRQDAAAYTLTLSGDAADHAVEFELQQNGRRVQGGTLALDAENVPATLRQFGLDPSVFASLRQNVSPPTVAARRSRLRIRGEEIDVYLLSIRQGETVMLDCYVSQLGQVLMAKTPFGYAFAAEDLK